MKKVITKTNFTETVALKEARDYLKKTLDDANSMVFDITWGFDEAQADSFHRSWTGDKFLRCIEKLMY